MGIIQQLLPPVVQRFIKPYALFDSFDSAKADCHSSGYDNDTLSQVIVHKTLNLQKDILTDKLSLSMGDLFLIQAIAMTNQKSLHVVDFGGAAGAHYLIAKTFFPDIDFQWHVIEIENLVKHCQQSTLPSDSLSFNTDLKSIPFVPDLLLTSGTLQHLPDPLSGLTDLSYFKAPWMVFNRLSLTTNPTFWIKHRWQIADSGPGPMPPGFENSITECPFAYVNSRDFENTLNQHGYHCFSESKDISAVFPIMKKHVWGENRLYRLNI